MLTLFHNNEEYPIQNTEYYIRELVSGLDEVIFELSIYDPIYAVMAEEENIVDRAGQTYLVKQIDAGASMAKVVCQLDIDSWKSQMYVDYDSGSLTCVQQIEAVKPTGWTITDHSSIGISRTIKGSLTAYEICVQCTETYGVYIRWDNKNKICHIYSKAMGSPVGAFATRELNLKEINYKGKSNNLATRLYAYGKDGLTFASINSGKPYVENNSYSSRVICAYWQDDRYTDKTSLLADAQEKLTQMAVPERSYECSIVDLQATNPTLYNNLDFSLLKVATLIDDVKNTAVNYQVVERHIYPYHPESNEVIFDNSPQKITAAVINIEDSINNPNSTFQQIQDQKIADATNWLLSGDGYVVAVQDSDGTWKELLFMDTNDISTAQDVLRINKNGIGFSTNGVNGPYANAWTIDGNLIADFITTGTMLADRIRGGSLEIGGYSNSSGIIKVFDPVSLGNGTYIPPTAQSVVFGYSQAGAVGTYTVDIVVSAISDPSSYNGKYSIQKTTDGSTFSEVASGPLVEGVTRVDYNFDIVNSGNVYYYIYVYRESSSYTASYNYAVYFNKAITTIDKDGIDTSNITARGGYIGNGTYGFKIGETAISNGPETLAQTNKVGAIYAVNGLSINVSGKHSHINGNEIFTNGTLSSKQFTIGDNGVLGVINGRFDNKNGMTIETTPDSSQFMCLHLNQNRWVPWTSSSDIRLKQNIKAIGYDFVRRIFKKLSPVSFEYKADKNKYTEYGLIAQDLEKVLSSENLNTSIVIELEDKDKDDNDKYKAINYQKLIGLLIPAVQDLYERVEALESEIEELKNNG